MSIEHPAERWAPVPNFPAYEVSDLGRVRKGRTMKRLTVRDDGYIRTSIHGRTEYVHVLVAAAFIGPRPVGLDVMHRDDNPSRNEAANLRYGTRRTNMLLAVEHGRHSSARKTRCPQNHSLTAPNLVASLALRGKRGCLSCARARSVIFQSGGDLQELADEFFAAIPVEAWDRAIEQLTAEIAVAPTDLLIAERFDALAAKDQAWMRATR